jgi:hypothetical protein
MLVLGQQRPADQSADVRYGSATDIVRLATNVSYGPEAD